MILVLASANRDPRAIFDGSRRISLRDREIAWTARMGHRWPEALNLTFEGMPAEHAGAPAGAN